MKKIVITFVFLFFSSYINAFYYEMDSNECLKAAKSDEEVLLCKNIEKQKKKYPQNSYEKYAEDGHLYTTFIVLRSAGISEEESYDIAYCSQLPDDNIKFSATLAFFYPNISYRNKIMGVIHSLHGGNEIEVHKRRSLLQSLISKAYQEKILSNCEIGIIIHAYADSYAHTYIKKKKIKAYGLFLGHLLHGHKPDVIAYYPKKFEHYIKGLYKVFKQTDSDSDFKKFVTHVKKLSVNRQKAIISMSRFARNKYSYDPKEMQKYKEKWKQKMTRANIEKVVKFIRNKI